VGLVVQPPTSYAWLGRDRIAYQVLGEGPGDLVFTPGSFGNIDMVWEDPAAALFLRRLASFSRLIRFDRRGTSASDPLPLDALPPWESYADEVTAVLDEIGSEKAAVMAMLDAGPMAMFFAATHPERTTALILANTSARWVATESNATGIPRELAEELIARVDEAWGTEAMVDLTVPSRAGDGRFRSWYARYSRSIAGPRAVRAFARALFEIDARSILPSIQVPTLVMHRESYAFFPIEHGRYIAEHIPGATLVELAGSDGVVFWETPDEILERVEGFLVGVPRGVSASRSLATVLFTDIVRSTERAAEVGDRRWRETLNVHDDVARGDVEASGGRFIKSTGDGILATFDGPGRGIRAAQAIRDDLLPIGVEIRAGLHTGEVEARGDDVGGIGVHIAARVMAEAAAGEILVSRTVRDLVVGSNIRTVERGTHALKGVEGDWELFEVISA
jgi:class 3 adenylate cyclase